MFGQQMNPLISDRPKLGIVAPGDTTPLLAQRCDIVSDQANAGALSSREELEKMVRRRFQRGSVLLRGKRKQKWVGRWREDVINSQGQLVRINRKEVFGTKSDFPTKKLAMRELEVRIAPINSVNYRALRTAAFAEFAEIWKNNVLTQHKTINAACGSEPAQEMAGPLLRELCHAGSRRTNGPNVRPTLLFGSEELP